VNAAYAVMLTDDARDDLQRLKTFAPMYGAFKFAKYAHRSFA